MYKNVAMLVKDKSKFTHFCNVLLGRRFEPADAPRFFAVEPFRLRSVEPARRVEVLVEPIQNIAQISMSVFWRVRIVFDAECDFKHTRRPIQLEGVLQHKAEIYFRLTRHSRTIAKQH